MADDRLFLRCKACGEFMLFWKHYLGDGGYLKPSTDELSLWMSKHLLECDGRLDFGLNPPLEIVTELAKLQGHHDPADPESLYAWAHGTGKSPELGSS